MTRLAELARQRTTPVSEERCELCSAPIGAEHRHLLEPGSRELLCACRACGLLFDRGGRYLLVPERRTRRLEGLELSDEEWERLRLPVDIAFFVRQDGVVRAYYPGPMGATESHLDFELDVRLEPEVEALLVNRAVGRREHWVVPIDDCFRLVGLIRTHWRGLTGGKEVWAEIGRFFDGLERR